MIVLDTNVVSELMREAPAKIVHSWLDSQPPTDLFVTSITQAEVLQGLEFLPKGKRREALAKKADVLFDVVFESRLLAFDSPAARAYAAIVADRRRRGRPIASFDGQIAAIARARGASIATRNIDDFVHCGIDLVDPWNA